MKLKKIILFVLIFISTVLFFNINSVFADNPTTLTFNDNGTTVTFNNVPSGNGFTYYAVVHYGSSERYLFAFSDCPFALTGNNTIYPSDESTMKYILDTVSNINTKLKNNNFSQTTSMMLPSGSTITTANCTIYRGNTVVYSYTPPESYNNLPYFLNSDEDIALGEQDLIIMPRRFSKRQKY